jgi:eukaryotic-like serine/threonine-protein kinase
MRGNIDQLPGAGRPSPEPLASPESFLQREGAPTTGNQERRGTLTVSLPLVDIAAGIRLGPYEILSPLGAGGMGEVWRARDTRLDRDVALKVLPATFATNAQFRARFEREAKTISSLSHPHICTLFDVGQEDGRHYLVMELLEGESLAERLGKGPLPIADVLRYGAEIAKALDAAHRRGIVHRDLKPGNVMLTRSGAKLLDFGLATSAASGEVRLDDATAKMPLTEEGTIVGTFQYMAPEQLEGQPADARTDIFALGVVLYEMASGQRAFPERTKASLIAAIVSGDPTPLPEAQPSAPLWLWRVIQLCLRKDRDERWQSAHDVRLELEMDRPGAVVSVAAAPPRRRWLLPAALAIIAMLPLAYLGGRMARATPVATPQHFDIASPVAGEIRELALSPDGQLLAMTAARGFAALPQLWVRNLSTGKAVLLEGTDGASHPFWSPDGAFIAFHRDGSLQRVGTQGSTVQTICRAGELSGATWSRKGTIVFALDHGLYRVDANGGEPQRLALPKDERFSWPSFLPDGDHLLVLTDGGPDADPGVAVTPLAATGSPRPVLRALSNAIYSETGHLLFVKGRTLHAQRFDAKTHQLAGAPVPIAEQVDDNDFNRYVFSAANGTLAYRSRDVRSQLRLRDRGGKELAQFGEPADWAGVAVSPDNTLAVAEKVDEDRRNGSLWLIDLQTGTISRFATTPGWQILGTWAPDSRRFAFMAASGGRFEVVEGRVNSTATRTIASMVCHPQSWSGDWIACETFSPETGADLLLLSASTGKTQPLAATKSWENGAHLSPDGRWLAYSANDGVAGGVFVQPVPPDGRRWPVPTATFSEAAWQRDGKRLFYNDGLEIFARDAITEGGDFRLGPAQLLTRARPKLYKNRPPLAVLGDGERFLINEPLDDTATAHVVLNWTARGKP